MVKPRDEHQKYQLPQLRSRSKNRLTTIPVRWSWHNNTEKSGPVISSHALLLLTFGFRGKSFVSLKGWEAFWCCWLRMRLHFSFPAIWQQTVLTGRMNSPWKELAGDGEEWPARADSNDVISHCVILSWELKCVLKFRAGTKPKTQLS